jgi:hypothetical protein
MSKKDEQEHQESKEKQQAIVMSSASTQAVASIASYCLANMAMTVTNKYVFSVRLQPLVSRVCTNVCCREQSSIFIVCPCSSEESNL